MGRSDSLSPCRRAWFPSLGDTMRDACVFAPVGPDEQPQAWS